MSVEVEGPVLPEALEQARTKAVESNLAWAAGTALTRNPRFVRELEARLAKAGFTHVFNVLEGFEGEIDAHQHRGGADGWRFHQLP